MDSDMKYKSLLYELNALIAGLVTLFFFFFFFCKPCIYQILIKNIFPQLNLHECVIKKLKKNVHIIGTSSATFTAPSSNDATYICYMVIYE